MKGVRDLVLVIVIAVSCTVMGVVGGYFLTAYQVNQSARHACTALDILTEVPVTPPANPAANPSRVATYHLYEGLVSWRKSTC